MQTEIISMLIVVVIAIISAGIIIVLKPKVDEKYIPSDVEPGENDIGAFLNEDNIIDMEETPEQTIDRIKDNILDILGNIKVGIGVTSYEDFKEIAISILKRKIAETVPVDTVDDINRIIDAVLEAGNGYKVLENTYDEFIKDYLQKSQQYAKEIETINSQFGDVEDADAVVEDVYKRDENGVQITSKPTKDTDDSFEEPVPGTEREYEFSQDDPENDE